MSKKVYDNNSVSCFPEQFKMELPSGYRIDTEYDDDLNEANPLRGGFYTNEDGEEAFEFTGNFISFNINVTGEGDRTKLQDRTDPEFEFNQVSEGIMENLQEQYGPGKILKLYNSFPAATIMKFYMPIQLLGVTLESYMFLVLTEIDEGTVFGFNALYQSGATASEKFYEHLLNVTKAIRVNGKPIDIGRLTAKKLEAALDMEPDENVEALDLGLSVGINIQNGDEEIQYTLNNDGSITGPDGEAVSFDESDDESGSIFDPFTSQEDDKEVRLSGDDSRTVIVDNRWSFRLPENVDLHFDTEHTDIMGNNTTSQYVLLGVKKGSRNYFDFELHTRFDFGMGTDLDVLGCRHDNDVMSGNAQQKIVLDGDDLYIDVVNKPIFFSRSMVMIRVRGEDLRPWDFVIGVDGMDEEQTSNWDEVKARMHELAESIQLVGSASKSAKKSTKKKEEASSDPDFIISDGVLRKYIGTKSDIVIPEGVKEIADSTFSGFSKLKSIVVPEGVKKIGQRCFENCTSLRNCYLPDSLEELGGYAFVDCHELKEVYLSEKLKTLGGSAFSECFVLKNIKIPKKIKGIDSFTFKNCDAFTHIVIPDGVKSIGVSAFSGCDNLEYLFVPKSVIDISLDFMNNHPFSGSEKLTIYTPEGSYAQKFAEEKGLPFENAAKGTGVADNAKAKSVSSDARSESETDNNGSLVFVDRVKVPGQNWSIGVPEGFKYSTDPKVNGKSSANPSGVYDLILAKPKRKRDVDFDSPYSNAISFVTLEYCSFHAFEMDLNIKKDEYETILLTDDLSVILIPMMSTGGVNSYFIYVNSEEQIRRCQLLISGPYKKEKKMEIARQLAESISLYTHEDSYVQKPASAPKSSGRASSRETKAKKPAGGGKTVTVDNTWTVTIPAGYKYSTDKSEIGEHRNIIFMEDKAGNDFDYPFNATISFTSMFNDGQGAPATVLAKMMAGLLGDSINVIRDDDDLYVCTYLFSKSNGEGDADVYKIDIGCGEGVSSIQVFFNSKLSGREEKKLVDTVAKSIRLASEEGFVASSSSPLSEDQQRQKAELDRQIADLRAQSAYYSGQDLSADDRETLNEINKGIDDLEKQMGEVAVNQDKYAEHLRQREEKEKQRQEEKERKKKEILASGKKEDVIVDMYVIMNIEKELGKTKRAQDKFYELYNDDFPTLDKKGLIGMRKYVLEKMKDPDRCKEFDRMFMQRSVEDRFGVSTANYFNVTHSNNIGIVEEAIDKTSRWYSREEFKEVRRLLDAHMKDMRIRLDEQMDNLEEKWKHFQTARDSLTITIKDSYASDAVKEDKNELFQTEVDGKLVEIALYTKGVLQLGFTLLNSFPWYWDKEIAEIWSAALLKNQINDGSFYNEDSQGTARRAFEKIKGKHPLESDVLRGKANDFVFKLKTLYDHPDALSDAKKTIRQMLKDNFSNKKDFSNCRRFLEVSGNVKDIPALNAMLEEGIPSSWIYDELAETAAKEITAIKEKRDAEEAERKYIESVKFLENGSLSDLIKAEKNLESLGSYKDAEELLKQSAAKLDEIRPAQYKEALELMGKDSIENAARAIELLDELGSYRDASDRADEYRMEIELMRQYDTAQKLSESDDLNTLYQAAKTYEGLGEYRDSESRKKKCDEKIETLKEKQYEEAILLERKGDEESLSAAKAIMIAIRPYSDAEERAEEIDSLITSERTYKTAIEKSSDASLSSLKQAKEMFESIGEYKDSDKQAEECEKNIRTICEEKIESAEKAKAVLSVKSQVEARNQYKEIEDWYEVDAFIGACNSNIGLIKDTIRLNHELEECKAELAKTKGRKGKKAVAALINEKEAEYSEIKTKLAESTGDTRIKVYEEGLTEAELNSLKAPMAELEKIREENEKRKKNAKWRNLILFALLVVLGLGVASVILEELKPDLSKYSDLDAKTIHGIKYKIPSEWTLNNSYSDSESKYYELSKNNKIIAATEIVYKGDTDLSGDAGYDAEDDNHYSSQTALDTIPNAQGVYQMVEAGESVFEVTIYCDPEAVNGSEEYLSTVCSTFQISDYQNPRVLKDVLIQYRGSTEEGTVIDSSNRSIDVEAEFDTGTRTGTKDVEWTIKEPVTLKAGETSKLTVIVDGKEYSTDIKCTTKPEDSKEQTETENNDETSGITGSGSLSGSGVSGRLPSGY